MENYFLKGQPKPVIISLKSRRELWNFNGLHHITEALESVDDHLKEEWMSDTSDKKADFKSRRRRSARLIHFEVASPPILTVLSDPGWLGALLTLLTGYKEIKSNIPIITDDIERLGRVIRGLSKEELKFLQIAVRYQIERVYSRGEETARAVRLVQKWLTNDQDEMPLIKVIHLEGNYDFDE